VLSGEVPAPVEVAIAEGDPVVEVPSGDLMLLTGDAVDN
jgi:hypothetical protein